MVDLNSPIIKEFLIESFDNLASISEELTKYENNSEDFELLNAIFRKVHTLKGSASFLSLKKLQEITHHGETLLDLLRDKKINVSSDIVDSLLESFDACLGILKNIETRGEEGEDNYNELIAKLSELSNQSIQIEKEESLKKQDIEAEENSLKIEVTNTEEFFSSKKSLPSDDNSLQFLKELIDKSEEVEKGSSIPLKKEDQSGVNVFTESRDQDVKLIDDPREVTQSLKVAEKINTSVEIKKEVFKKYLNEDSVVKEASANVKKKVAGSSLVDSVVRVNVTLLDKIMNVVGELVLNRNQILQYANQDSSSELSRLAHALNAITTELQTDIMTTRMQPVGSVLTKFERVVRDLARSQEKNIKLNITGKDTELDKTLLEAIRDPLTHLIRNAVDHGIEKPKDREESGKPSDATVNIKAYHEGGQVTIEISDDGKGIDPDVILKKAIEKSLVSENHKNLSKKQIINLIFAPGFSTAAAVTNISGRGVGMDVVKSNVEKIGGTVEVSSDIGVGTIFKLKIPLTLAIVPALVVQTSNETFAIPQVNLMELVRIEEDDDKRIEIIHDSEFFRLRGDLIPIFRLNKALGYKANLENKETNIVILKAEGNVYGLIVDSVLDTEEIVVKPLSRELKELQIYGGATIMGDGSVALIIDGLGFYNHMSGSQTQKKDNSIDIDQTMEGHVAYNDEVLLGKLGDGREYGIPLAIVHRLEEFKVSDVEWSGDQPLIRYLDKAMPLINLEKTLGLDGTSLIESKDKDLDLPVVVINIRGIRVGYVVSEISDIAINYNEISSETSSKVGFLGAAYINDSTITILDVYSIFDSQRFTSQESNTELGTILVVEDSELFLKIQEENFKDAGFSVITAKNGKEGLSKYSKDIFAIVSDIEMPEMNGWDFVKEIRKDNTDIPMIAISSVTGKKYDEIIEAGFDLCFDKQDSKKAISALIELVRQN